MNREPHLGRAVLLSALSVAISGLFGGLAIVAGVASGRLSLLGFGFDAAIDSVASIVLLWRFRIEARQPARAERAERLAERAVGAVLLILAVYLAINAVRALTSGAAPEATETGIAISVSSVLVLPI